MATSTLHSKVDLINFQVLVGGTEIPDSYELVSIDIIQEVYKLPYAKVVLRDGNPFSHQTDDEFAKSEKAKFEPGKEIKINLGWQQQADTIFKGIVASQSVKVNGNTSELILKCTDKATKLTLGRKCKIFTNKKDSDVISSIISDAGLNKSVESTIGTIPEILQYHVTDWDYILTRSELNGMIVLVDDGKVTIKKPKTSGAQVSVKYGESLLKIDADLDARSQYKSIEAKMWSYKENKEIKESSQNPTTNNHGNLTSSSLANIFAPSKIELHTAGNVEKNTLKSWASAYLLKSHLSKIRGTLSTYGNKEIKPDTLIKIQGMGDRFNGDAYISKVHHHVSEGRWESECTMGLSHKWFSETQPDIMMPAGGGMLPGIHGLFIGTVSKIHDDPANGLRICLELPFFASNEKVWARLSTMYASSEHGTFFYPEIGDEVVVGFLQGDPSNPVVVGSVYSPKKKTPHTPDNGNTIKAIVTKNKLRLTFEDQKKNIVIETPGGNKFTLSDENKKITIEDSNQNKIEMSNSGILLDSPKTIEIKAMQDIKLSATKDVKVSGMNVSSEANMKMEMKSTTFSAEAQISVKIKANVSATLESSVTTTIKGAFVNIN